MPRLATVAFSPVWRCSCCTARMGICWGNLASPYTNKRTDRYGGSLENRARFAIEVLTAIRRKVGDKWAIEYRVSADELVPEGMHPEETIRFVKMIEDMIDLLHVSAGLLTNPLTIPHMIQPTYFPRGYNVHYAEKLRSALKVPVTAVGSIDLDNGGYIDCRR